MISSDILAVSSLIYVSHFFCCDTVESGLERTISVFVEMTVIGVFSSCEISDTSLCCMSIDL